MPSLWDKFENNKIFTEEEAWTLFKLSAIAEACGWTLLIIGIGLSDYVFPGNHAPVLVAGRVHGILFLLYALASVGLYPALRWSRKRAFVALLASIPPYGSLAFEIWAAHKRQNEQFNVIKNCVALNILP